MKRQFILTVLLCFGLALSASADPVVIDTIAVQDTTGIDAEYVASTGALGWSEGAVTQITKSDGGTITLWDSLVDFNFDLDVSNGTDAAFDLVGTWNLKLYTGFNQTGKVLDIVGTLNAGRFDGQYLEESSGSSLNGKAWVEIDVVNSWADSTWLASNNLASNFFGDNNILGMTSVTSLDYGQTVSDYATDDYTSNNGVTVTIYADEEQVVPEPITAVLLSLGSVVLLKRKTA